MIDDANDNDDGNDDDIEDNEGWATASHNIGNESEFIPPSH